MEFVSSLEIRNSGARRKNTSSLEVVSLINKASYSFKISQECLQKKVVFLRCKLYEFLMC